MHSLTILSFLVFVFHQELVLGKCSTPTIDTSDGKVCGGSETSREGLEFQSFQGIPFAAPPIGPLRFRKPDPTQPWSGVMDVSEKKTEFCIQYDYFVEGKLAGQEDCLYLNVYKPQGNTNDALPIMIWVFGGGWSYGSGTWDEYGPEMFMDYEVILVTFNYRLGPLGFLSLGTEEVPGNQGLHDMVAALTWVQTNIGQFGGDPEQVTIFGESAGSWGCSYLTVSPLARGLFSRAILQSGTFTIPHWPWLSKENGTKLGLAAANLVGCNAEDNNEVLECLVEADLSDIQTIQKDENIHPPTAVIDDSFLPDSPLNLLINGDINPVEIIIGTVQDEGLLYTQKFIRNPELYSNISSDWAWHGPRDLFGKRGADDITEQDERQADEVLDFYIDSQNNFDEDHFANLTNMMTDRYWYGTHKMADLLADQGVTVYQYMFSYKGDNSYLDSYGINSSLYGVAHSDELYFMFNPYWFGEFELSEDDSKISNMFMKLVTDFAKFGDPTPPGAVLSWDPVTAMDHRYLRIGQENTEMDKSGDYQRRVDFWDEIMAERSPGSTQWFGGGFPFSFLDII